MFIWERESLAACSHCIRLSDALAETSRRGMHTNRRLPDKPESGIKLLDVRKCEQLSVILKTVADVGGYSESPSVCSPLGPAELHNEVFISTAVNSWVEGGKCVFSSRGWRGLSWGCSAMDGEGSCLAEGGGGQTIWDRQPMWSSPWWQDELKGECSCSQRLVAYECVCLCVLTFRFPMLIKWLSQCVCMC